MEDRMKSSISPYSHLNFAIVDTETTGTSSRYGRIIEIGILRVEQGKVTRTYQTLINPERRIPEVITAITGIDNDALENAPTFAEVADEISELLGEAIFVAHNARFDYGFLKEEFGRLDRHFTARLLCTVELSRKLFPEYRHHDLTSLIERYRFTCKARHRAYDDAAVLWEFLSHVAKQKSKESREKLETTIAGMLKAPSIPPQLEKSVIKKLPDGHGVYIFYGKKGEVLYVGKSVNIRTRVMSHFSAANHDPKERHIREEVTDIETRETHGELGALLLELELIKTLQPVYNRIARKVKSMTILRERLNDEGYTTAEIERVISIEGFEDGSVLGIFRSTKQAREFMYELATNHELCPKILGLESGMRTCFAYQLKRCKGACAGDEDSVAYNARFAGAFGERRIRIWPFKGPIIFEEKAANGIGGQAFMINDWRLIKRYTYDEVGVHEEQSQSPIFDYDAYKILVSFLLNKKNSRSIKLVGEPMSYSLEPVFE